MRLDKLTSKFQEALGEAQSLALSADNQYIESEHHTCGEIEFLSKGSFKDHKKRSWAIMIVIRNFP